MKPSLPAFVPAWGVRAALVLAVALALPACQDPRLARLEAVQQQQARELARLRQQLAERDEEVQQLENCVDDLESTVYADDSTADDEEPSRPSTTLL
ncbi:hypothetical protein JAO73_06395 [Hymenobacter sp. BT523]|uniref:hypothetical protein n=1 Tax=Hymenobacter sp. BT523 TaxID=2795725 RepID=UPI0018EDA6CA|nr:hypothetical protein [Hymenobacter sp. BT523]MBJ6108628.1 hypothetical protein [Hymenobacter sp. BT523]